MLSRAIAKAAARNLARVRTLESLTAPAVGDVVDLPGGLRATGMNAGPTDLCEMCCLPIAGVCYGIGIGGCWITVHAACLGGCR